MRFRPPEAASGLVIRHAASDDLPGILELARTSLGWPGGDEDARFFHWKHFENPFGPSPMWVALDEGRIVGFRTFLRWRFERRGESPVVAVRAVDTATDPAARGRGIFTELTLAAVDELRAEGVDLIFNTPNPESLAGYLKMGWSVVGRLPTAVMPTRVASLFALATARHAASLRSIEIRVGEPASDVFGDRDAIARLLAERATARGLSTRRTPEFLAWRYGYEPLRYRVVLGGSSVADGFAVFRLRRRGNAVEAVVCDVLTPNADARAARSLMRAIARLTGADYLIRLARSPVSRGPFVCLPRTGPTLTCRALKGRPAPGPRGWDLTMGDIELF